MTSIEALLLSISGFTGMCALAALWRIQDDCKKRAARRARQREAKNAARAATESSLI
jgi:hypothetical protein